MKKSLAALVALVTLALPLVVQAYPFGGAIGQIIFCYNNAIYAAVGPPRGGPFIWTPSTRTYQFGPPSHTGQWLLGLAAPPYYCLVSIQPIIVWSGILMTMEGSSGGAAPGGAGGGLGNYSGNGGTGGTGGIGGTGSSGIAHVIVSEVYPQADSGHGGAVADEWIEIYNPTTAAVNLSHWTILTKATSQTIPDNTSLAPGQYLVLSGTTQVRQLWNISSSAQVLAFSSAFAGFSSAGDDVFLQDTTGARIDSISYGTDTGAFAPSVPAVVAGHSIIRKTLSSDTDAASDWTDTSGPTPGR